MFKSSSLPGRVKPLSPEDIGPAGLLAAMALFLLARLYEGLRHDAALYFGQVLHRRGELRLDPFFVAGSQDSFSFYSSLLSPIYGLASPAFAHQALLFASLMASFFAVWALLRRLDLLPICGLFAVASLSPYYGGLLKFGFFENFITGRTLAEPLVLWSLLPLAAGRLLPGLALQIAAAAFHPLMALPALAVTWFLAVMRDWRWSLLLAVPASALAYAALGHPRWEGFLLGRFDAYWWSLVSQSNVQTVLANWTLSDWLTAVTDGAVVASVAFRLPGPQPRRLLLASLAVAAALTAFAGLATDGLHWVLATQMQLWRALWLVHLLALAVAPWLVWQLWISKGLFRLAAGLLTLALISSHTASVFGAPVLAGWALCEWGGRRGWTVSASIVRFGLAACALGVLSLNFFNLQLQIERLYWNPIASETVGVAARVLTAPVVAFALMGALLWLSRGRRAAKALAAVASSALLVFAALNWDQRDAMAHTIESPPAQRPFQQQIPPQATVFWPERLAAVWGLLGRASHFLPQQGAGMLFNRTTAEIIGPRREAYRPIRDDRERCEASVWLQHGSARDLEACLTPSIPRLQELCSKADHPDFLVFGTPLRAPTLATWDLGDQRFHLYRCSQFAPTTEQPAVQNDRSPANS